MDYPTERRRAKHFKLTDVQEVVPLHERKPSAWTWRQNPFEKYEFKAADGFEDRAYVPADILTAYNLAASFLMF